ncbi:MAG: hypothetical protein JKY71_06885 [Alphaproteobacteria bacterium]|nr:hypothetical protein [Alphaproteobacteria bacterium]
MQGVRASQGKAFHLPDTGWVRDVSTFLGAQLSLQRPEAFLWSPVFIACGILIYFALSFEPPLVLAGGLIGVATVIFFLTQPQSFMRLAVTGVLLVALGFAAGTVRTAIVHTPVLDKEIQFADVKGYISSVEKLDGLVLPVMLTGLGLFWRLRILLLHQMWLRSSLNPGRPNIWLCMRLAL